MPPTPRPDVNFHVATVQEEAEKLPTGWFQTLYQDIRYEPVFFVNETTDQIESGYMVDTDLSNYFSFAVLEVDGIVDTVPTSDWLPCDDPDE